MNTRIYHSLKLKINITAQQIYGVCRLILLLNLLMLAGTWLHHSGLLRGGRKSIQVIVLQFNLATENIVAALYASMLFFMVGMAAVFCFWADQLRYTQPKQRLINWGWLLMAGLFMLLSFDEIGSFHESASELPLVKDLKDNSTSMVELLLLLVVALGGLFMSIFFVLKFKENKKTLFLTLLGVLLLASNPLQEHLEISAWQEALAQHNWEYKRPIYFLVIEEGTELFASICFLFAFLVYSLDATPTKENAPKAIQLQTTLPQHLESYLVLFFLAFGTLMLAIYLNPWETKVKDKGMPQNWFPCLMSFLSFLSSVYLYHTFKQKFGYNRRIYFLVGLISICIAAYFGGNMYYYQTTFVARLPFILMGSTFVIALLAILEMKGGWIRTNLALWALSFGVSTACYGFYNAFLGYIAYCFLFMALFLHYKRLKQLTENF